MATPQGSLADDVEVTAAVATGGTSTMQLAPANTGEAIPVTVTIAFPFAEEDGEAEVLDLGSLTLDLVQNP